MIYISDTPISGITVNGRY